MSSSATALAFQLPVGRAATLPPAHFPHYANQNPSVLPNHIGGKAVPTSITDARTNFSAETDAKTLEHVSTDNLVDFTRERANRYTEKELARLTGLSIAQVKNLRLGRSGVSGKTISNWCRNDPAFRAEYFRFCGGHLEGEPEMVAALSRAINAIVRGIP